MVTFGIVGLLQVIALRQPLQLHEMVSLLSRSSTAALGAVAVMMVVALVEARSGS